MSATVTENNWAVTLYIDNLFDKYAYTSVRRDQADLGLNQVPSEGLNRVDLLRNYGRFVVQPRKVGVKFSYKFDM